MTLHKQVKIQIKDKFVYVDCDISNIIFTLNNKYNLETTHSCQGDTQKSGYIKFTNNTDLSVANEMFNLLTDDYISVVDFSNNCIRFFSCKNAWLDYYDVLKSSKKFKAIPLK